MIKEIIKKIIYGKKASQKSYIKYLKKIGITIGEDVSIYSPKNTIIDEQYPWLITIGNHVRITEGVIILTHDYSWSVLKKIKLENILPGAVLGASGKVVIGNNVFIGMNSIILRNTIIEDNVIIGAGSVVCNRCEEGWVYAGNPAKKILTVEEYYKKRKKKQLEEAVILAKEYKKKYEKIPEKEVFHEYFMLFDNLESNSIFKKKASLCENFNESFMYLKENIPVFSNYNEFLNFCFKEEENYD